MKRNGFRNEPLASYKLPEIYYNSKGVMKSGTFYPTDNPRLLFAEMLDEIDREVKAMDRDWDQFMPWPGTTKIHCRVKYDDRKVKIGQGCVIGGQGFGYVKTPDGKNFPMPHLGGVLIEDGVIIHNNTCIDRAVLGDTVIGEGTVIDNLVHIAHGVQVGKGCTIIAGAVIGGSSVLGDNCYVGINASIRNKLTIGSHVIIGMGAVVVKSVPDYAIVLGNPARIEAWQNEVGERLHFDEEGMARDTRGKYYQLKNKEVKCVEFPVK